MSGLREERSLIGLNGLVAVPSEEIVLGGPGAFPWVSTTTEELYPTREFVDGRAIQLLWSRSPDDMTTSFFGKFPWKESRAYVDGDLRESYSYTRNGWVAEVIPATDDDNRLAITVYASSDRGKVRLESVLDWGEYP